MSKRDLFFLLIFLVAAVSAGIIMALPILAQQDTGAGNDETPDKTPKSDRLFYLSRPDEMSETKLFMYTMTTGEAVAVPNMPEGHILGLVWSPDGSKALFSPAVSLYGGVNTGVFMLDAETLAVQPITLADDQSTYYGFSWSPDSKQIAYSGGGKTHIVDITTGAEVGSFASGVVQPVWSPDGSVLVFSEISPEDSLYRDIYLYDINSGIKTNLTRSPQGTNSTPAWSPDGQTVYFTSRRDDNWEIYAMNPDGSNVRNLTQTPGHNEVFYLSPDGSQIAYTSLLVGVEPGDRAVYLMDAGGSSQRLISDQAGDGQSLDPRWSPDGSMLAFNSFVNNQLCLFTLDVSSGVVTQYSSDMYVEGAPAWSPDGQWLSFMAKTEVNQEYFDADVYLISSDGTNGPQNITHSPAYEFGPEWQP